MMNKKYLMKGFAALALVAGFSSCVKDVASVTPAEQEAQAKENAELQLGLNIPDGQTWDMSTQITANVTVNLNASETYTVGICDKNPLNYEDAKFYALKSADGGYMSTAFTAPAGKKDYYVVAYNSKYQALVNRVEAENGVINANISYTSASSRTMRAANRATAHGITFPDGPANEDYATAAPEGTEDIQAGGRLGYYGEKGTFYADENSDNKTVQINGAGGVIYLVKNSTAEHVTITPSKFYMAACNSTIWDPSLSWDDPNQNRPVPYSERTRIYVCPGVTLKLLDTNDGGCKGQQKGIVFYIAEGAGLEAENELRLNNLTIFNKGTITVPEGSDLVVNESGLLYNQGTVNVGGKIKVANATSHIINEGTITAAEFGSEGSGTFWNTSTGDVTITGETLVNSNSNGWVNDGQYTTKTFVYNAGSVNVYNTCMLTVKELFTMTLGDSSTSTFYNEGSIVCEKDFSILGPSRINMASNSVIQVAGTATVGCKKAFYGIYGPATGNYAVFKADKIVAHTDNQEYTVSYGGNLAVVCNSHFAQSTTGRPFIGGGNTDGFDPGAGYCQVTIYQGGNMPDIPEIPETPCNPGFKPGDGTDDFLDEAEPYTFAFEDQIYNGDYDLNDVVLKITPHAVRNANKKITAFDNDQLDVKLVAAGATFNINAYIDDTPLFDGNEIHTALGVNAGVMVNTGNGTQGKDPVSCTIATPASIKSTNADGETVLDFSKLNVWIWVNKGSGAKSEQKIYYLVENAEKDENGNNIKKVAPYSIMIPYDWSWPTERTCITKAYKGKKNSDDTYDASYSFAKWAETPDAERGTDENKKCLKWFEYPNGLTIKDVTATSAGTIK